MLGIALFIAAFIFASVLLAIVATAALLIWGWLWWRTVLLAIVATAALLIWGWLWWRTREVRRAARDSGNVVIEGEYRVERETRRLEDD